MKTAGYGSVDTTKPLQPVTYELRALGDNDIHMEVMYCGICHSDIHCVRGEWGPIHYPCIPGHECTGIVKAVGKSVTKFKAGDKIGVGVFSHSCLKCEDCHNNDEQFCPEKWLTYGSEMGNGDHTKGGYGRDMVVDQHFCLDFSRLDLAKGAPLLCAGITVYSAIKENGFDKAGNKVGVMGLGGLGHMAVQLLKALGVTVVVLSHSPSKKDDAIKLGASEFVLSNDEAGMAKLANSLDGIVDTVSAEKNWGPYLSLLKNRGTIATVGLPPGAAKCIASPAKMVIGHKRIAGGGVGGIKITQEMLDLCADKNIYPWVEMTTCDKVEEAFKRTASSDVKYRFVMDIKGSAPHVAN